MYTMNYYIEKVAHLEDIEIIAKSQEYETNWLIEETFKPRLNIIFGSGKQWWQWYQMDINELWFDDESDKYKITKLNPQTILLFEYRAKYIKQVSQFMEEVMKVYGGWLDCKGDGSNLITIDNLSQLTKMCP